MHRSLMHLQVTNDRNGNMKTLRASHGIRKASFSVARSLEEKLGAPDHLKSLMTESQTIPHSFYSFSLDLGSSLVLSFSVERHKSPI